MEESPPGYRLTNEVDYFRIADKPSGAVGGVGLWLPFCVTIGPPCILAKGGSERAWEL